MNLKGSYVALVTPFHADGSVNLEKLRELCEWHIQEGTDGLVPLGTTGEASTLTQQEQDAVAQCVIDTVAGRVPVIVGAGSNATAVSAQKARHYAQMGADGVLAITPYYNKANEEGMVRHFETIADAAGVPVVMYNVPGRTACSLSVQAVERLIEPRLRRRAPLHLGIERVEPGLHIRQTRGQLMYGVKLRALVGLGLEEAGYVPGHRLAPVVYEAHPYDPRHVELGELLLEQQRHAGQAEAVLGDALVPPGVRPAVPGVALHVFELVQEGHKFCALHLESSLSLRYYHRAGIISTPGGSYDSTL